MFDVAQVTELHRIQVERWHTQPVDNRYDGFLAVVCTQHGFNFLLWHEEDIARSPDVTDTRIAEVKRAIDRYNQQRNDWIEKLDDWITEEVQRRGIQATSEATQNTETPGSVIDRLSVLSLRIYHLEEQLQRTDVSAEHLESVQRKVATCRIQHADLSLALSQLIGDIVAGRKRHKTYRQFKMYNDPTLNPYLYAAPRRAS